MQNRPKFLTLTQIHMPLPALVSILHRVSGAALFLSLPLLLWLFQQSLVSFGAFAAFRNNFPEWIFKLAATGLLWGFFHHLCAGLRFLALDIHVGTELETARKSSKLVLAGGVVLTILVGWRIW
jgi:succinate dehydrogenase / fumarate reductase cytochrome b subunit